MKKTGVLIISLLFFSLFINLILTTAQETPPGLPSELNQDPNELIEQAKNKTQTSADYLKQEWKQILLDKPVIGPIIRFADKVLSPLSLAFLKRDIEFSWTYLFTLAIWIIIIFSTYKFVKPAFNMNSLLAIGSGIILASLAIRTVPSAWFEFQITLIWKVIIILVIIALAVGYSLLIDNIIKSAKKAIEQRRERKAKTTERIHNLQIKST